MSKPLQVVSMLAHTCTREWLRVCIFIDMELHGIKKLRGVVDDIFQDASSVLQ